MSAWSIVSVDYFVDEGEALLRIVVALGAYRRGWSDLVYAIPFIHEVLKRVAHAAVSI